MRTTRWMFAAWIACAAAAPGAWAIEGDGLLPHADPLPWARWQGRLAVDVTPVWRAGLHPTETDPGSVSFSLMGDYYFSSSSGTGGFRATSGVIVGSRSALWAPVPRAGVGAAFSVDRRLFGAVASTAHLDVAPDTLPYLGVGYTGLSAGSAWGFSADVGLVALAPRNAVKLGRVVSGAQGLDDLVRDLRLTPVLQLGVSYSF